MKQFRYGNPIILTGSLLGVLAACSESSPSTPAGVAGSPSAGTTATAGSGGSNTSGTAGSATSGSGGGPVAGTGGNGVGGTETAGSGGQSPGGTGGTDGLAGSGGSGGADMTLSFFATSEGSGTLGGNLGGLAGADAICQALAEAVGAGGKTWHAYLSTAAENAVQRIGNGPWYNVMGEQVAADLAALMADGISNGDPQHILDENGVEVPGPEHDVLTGSTAEGTVMAGATCQDWTSNSTDDVAQVGHSDIPGNPQFSPSWNSAHESESCSEAGLDARGGSGRLYCFAID